MDTNLVDIVRSIVDRIDRNIRITEIVGNRAYVCSTLWVTIGKIIKDQSGFEWRVTDFQFNEWIDLEPVGHSTPLSGTLLEANAILFLHGSPSSTNNEYLLIKSRTMKKTPFIWLLVSYEYDNLPADSSVIASYSVRLFFMDWANTPKWRNDEHNDLVIKPMENLSQAFINVIENDYSFKRLGTYTRRPRPRFGVEVTDRGSDKTIIHENLSGIDLSVTLELFDLSTCCK